MVDESFISSSFDLSWLLTYPIGYESGKRYPLLLVVHGGLVGFFIEEFIGTLLPHIHSPLLQDVP
jgi:hypothetical protein